MDESGPVTLLTATRDLEHSQAAVLAHFLGSDPRQSCENDDRPGDPPCGYGASARAAEPSLTPTRPPPARNAKCTFLANDQPRELTAEDLRRLPATEAGGTRTCQGLPPEASDQLDLNGDVERKLGKADGAASVPSGGFEDLDQQVRASVNDRRSLIEAGRDIHHSEDFDDPLDAVEVTEFGLQRCQDRQTCLSRCSAPLFQGQVANDLATDDDIAVDGSMPSYVHQPVVYDASQIVSCRRKHRWKHNAELLKSLSDHVRSVRLEGTHRQRWRCH
jgi:hypothetical protein